MLSLEDAATNSKMPLSSIISTQPTVLRLYLHVYPLKGVSGVLHCWFPREGITVCLEQTLGGIQSSLQECGSEPKAAGAADPRKAQGLQGVQ